MKCAGGILVKGNKILLGKRSGDLQFYPGVWDIIGGHCKNGETPEQALKREFREEIGVIPISFSRVAVLHDPDPIRAEYEYYVYVVEDWTGLPKDVGGEHSELRWVTIDEAVTLDLAHPEYPELFKRIQREIEKSTKVT
ncbi:MAG: hypothetical protein AYK19_09015 [Theionarchaea archaeon DG-70-1]|nr:MAG: hypothetical protein AYK19_09015 [Theionarchaea archaeon DG-70-1]